MTIQAAKQLFAGDMSTWDLWLTEALGHLGCDKVDGDDLDTLYDHYMTGETAQDAARLLVGFQPIGMPLARVMERLRRAERASKPQRLHDFIKAAIICGAGWVVLVCMFFWWPR